MIKDFFQDDFQDIDEASLNDTTFQFVEKDEKQRLEWLNRDIATKVGRAQTRLERIRQLRALYKGVNYKTADARTIRENLGLGSMKPRDAKVFVNFVNEMTEAKVAQRSRFKPSIAILPNADEISDKNNAQTCKQLLDCTAQTRDFEKLFSDGDKINFLSGESYTYVLWDKTAGGVNPKVQALKEQGIKLPGSKQNPMNGDFITKLRGPDRSFPQIDKDCWEECDDISEIEWVHVDELKALYPDKADKIFANEEALYWDSANMVKRNLRNHCMVVNYYHRVTRFLPEGYRCRYIRSCMLEGEDLTVLYKHGKLPVVMDTDIDLDGELHGRPFVDNIARLQAVHNMVMASQAKSYAIASNPKWLAPAGSVSINKLTNEYGVLEYKGAQAPQLVSYSGIPKDSWEYAEKTERYIEKQSSVYGISRGEPPKGIKAAVALQFLDEQELQRESRGMAKRQRRILDVYKLVLQTMAQHYTPEDGRIFQMLGSDNSYLVKTFNLKGVSNYDIRMQNSSSLPDSKTGKIAAILDLNSATINDPYFGKEEISSILEMGNDQRFKDKLAISVKAADTIIQKIFNGEKDLEPNEWDDTFVQYPIFLRALQERDYKESDISIVTELVAYITTMEYLMIDKARMNPNFMMKLNSLYMFPVFYKAPVIPPMPTPPGTPTPPQGSEQQTTTKTMDLGNMKKTTEQQQAVEQQQEVAQ